MRIRISEIIIFNSARQFFAAYQLWINTSILGVNGLIDNKINHLFRTILSN